MVEREEQYSEQFDCGKRVRPILQDILSGIPANVSFRSELQRIISTWLEEPPRISAVDRVPRLACAANGGDPRRAVPLTAAWQLMRLSAKLLDDVEDRAVTDAFAFSINFATALLASAHLALANLPTEMSSDSALRIIQGFDSAVLEASAGQHADLKARQQPDPVTPEQWLEIAAAKSGSLFGWAAWAGALAAGADGRALGCYREYGKCLGVLVQVADDLHDAWKLSVKGDLETNQLSLPISFGGLVGDQDERESLRTLLRNAQSGDMAAQAEAQELLIGMGAQGYCLVVARLQRRQAVDALERAHSNPNTCEPLIDLLDRVLPVPSLVGS